MSLILSGTDGLSDVDGSASTPAIRGTDANTGIFFPAADTIAFAEGGVESMRLDSSGNVGIGTGIAGAITPSLRLGNSGSGGGVVTATLSLGSYSTGYGSNLISSSDFSSSSASYLAFGTTPSGASGLSAPVERMRIDSSGRVGIGINSPSAILSCYATGGSTVAGLFRTDQTDAYISFRASGTASDFSCRMGVIGENLVFLNNGANERMRIDSSGNLLVGTTSLATPGGAPGKMEVKANAGAGFQWASVFNNATTTSASVIGVSVTYTGAAPNGTGNEFLYCIDTSAVRATIRSNGGIANYSANNVNISDAREKTNVELAGSYLDKICAIPVKTFNYIDQNRDEDDGLTLGVIAQDVEAVAPELVMESNWGSIEEPKMRLSIYQTDLQYALMKCIQEQQAMIEELKAEVAALKAA